jgi:hypothetical protein
LIPTPTFFTTATQLIASVQQGMKFTLTTTGKNEKALIAFAYAVLITGML